MIAESTQKFGGRPSAVGRLLLLFVLMILLAVIARELPSALAPGLNPELPVTYTTHAEQHAETAAIRRCLEQRGADQVWRSRSWREPFKFFRTCNLDDGRTGLQIVKWSWRALAWREITSFIVKDGRIEQIYEYLTAIAERQ